MKAPKYLITLALVFSACTQTAQVDLEYVNVALTSADLPAVSAEARDCVLGNPRFPDSIETVLDASPQDRDILAVEGLAISHINCVGPLVVLEVSGSLAYIPQECTKFYTAEQAVDSYMGLLTEDPHRLRRSLSPVSTCVLENAAQSTLEGRILLVLKEREIDYLLEGDSLLCTSRNLSDKLGPEGLILGEPNSYAVALASALTTCLPSESLAAILTATTGVAESCAAAELEGSADMVESLLTAYLRGDDAGGRLLIERVRAGCPTSGPSDGPSTDPSEPQSSSEETDRE